MKKDSRLFEVVDCLKCDEGKTVQQICEECSACEQTIRSKLEVLVDAGVVYKCKDGRSFVYWKPFLSDRRVRLELYGALEMVQELHKKISELIDKTGTPIDKYGSGGS